jgi:hypothetical protein
MSLPNLNNFIISELLNEDRKGSKIIRTVFIREVTITGFLFLRRENKKRIRKGFGVENKKITLWIRNVRN